MRAILTLAMSLLLCGHAFAEDAPLALPKPEACALKLKKRPSRKPVISETFEADTRAAFGAYEKQFEDAEEKRIIGLRDQLADLENANPQGFNTFTQSNRDGMSVEVRSLLQLGQDRRVKMLVGQLVVNARHLYNDLQELNALKEETIQAYFASDLRMSQSLNGLIKNIDDNRFVVRSEIGETVWLYSGIVSTLLEDAGLKKRSGLIADGIEQALQNDLSKAFVARALPAGGALPTEEVPAAQTPQEVAKITALRVLQALRVVGDDGKTEIAPSLSDFEKILQGSARVRTGKLEAEIKFERKQQRLQWILGVFSDQYLMDLLVGGLNMLTLNKFKEFFDKTRAELEKGVNQSIHRGRILQFLGLADKLSDDPNGNAQLANALITLLGTDPALLSSLAVTREGIDPLRRVKSVDIVKTTIWGEKGQKLSEVIEELEGQRAAGLRSGISGNGTRSHKFLTATVAGVIVYATVMHASTIEQISTGGFDTLKALLKGLF